MIVENGLIIALAIALVIVLILASFNQMNHSDANYYLSERNRYMNLLTEERWKTYRLKKKLKRLRGRK